MFKLEDVSYCYHDANKLKALDSLSFEIKEGKTTGITGPIGSGKTTLAFILAGLIKPANGNVKFKNKIIGSEIQQRELWRKVGLVQQLSENQLFESSVFDEIAFALRNASLGKEQIEPKVIESARKVALDESYIEKSPFKLSGGEKRQVAIASVICYDPEVLIFDEPTVALDLRVKKAVYDYLKSKKGDKTVIIISHDPDELSLCEETFVLFEGRLLAKGKTVDLMNNPPFEDFPVPSSWRFFDSLAKKGLLLDKNKELTVLARELKDKYGTS